MVRGGYGHSRVREFVLGGATRGIRQTMTVPVLMALEPALFHPGWTTRPRPRSPAGMLREVEKARHYRGGGDHEGDPTSRAGLPLSPQPREKVWTGAGCGRGGNDIRATKQSGALRFHPNFVTMHGTSPGLPSSIHRVSFGASDTMATQIVMDHTGDTRHQFDPADPGAVAEAERRFKELTGSGFTAAKRLDDGKSEVVKSFDPTAEETLFIPRLQGG
jgi:hypothetical protein